MAVLHSFKYFLSVSSLYQIKYLSIINFISIYLKFIYVCQFVGCHFIFSSDKDHRNLLIKINQKFNFSYSTKLILSVILVLVSVIYPCLYSLPIFLSFLNLLLHLRTFKKHEILFTFIKCF